MAALHGSNGAAVRSADCSSRKIRRRLFYTFASGTAGRRFTEDACWVSPGAMIVQELGADDAQSHRS